MSDFDALFEQFADNAEAEAKAAANKGNGSFQRTYEDIAWTGLKTGIPTIFRAVGGPPDSNVDKYTAKTCTIARVLGDDGRKFKLVRNDEDPNYIINKILATVNRVRWVNNQKTFPNREILLSNPRTADIIDLIEKNGVKQGDRSYIFETGWKGKKVLIMNIIDRSMMDWHREHKHTRLLAKNVDEVNGNTFVDEGVSSFGTIGEFTKLFRAFHSWEKYDIAITRTGQKLKAYDITNASRIPEMLPADLRDIISTNDSLTEEEKSWEKYDIEKFYKPTSAIKIQNKLGKTIKRIDAALGTSFADELANEVAIEKAELEALNADAAEKTAPSYPQTTPVTRQPVTETSQRIVTGAEGLPFYNTLDDRVKGMIKSARLAPNSDSEKHWEVEWNCSTSDLGACPECGTYAPIEGVHKCPACGVAFD